MGYELLEALAALLRQAGLQAGEEFPGYQQPEVKSPTAAVGLRELDAAAGLVRYNVRILSPRILGGWCCQIWAARAVRALDRAGMTCQTGEMEYLSGSDCFCVTVTAVQTVIPEEEGWVPGVGLMLLCQDTPVEGVVSFTARRDRGRRLIGAFCQSEPVGITPGRDGWQLELVQQGVGTPEQVQEPFTLTVREHDRQWVYTGCGWNEERYEHTGQGLRLIRRGFALGREEHNG